MTDIFEKNTKKQALKDKLYYYVFYTLLLYFFAMLVVLISKDNDICLTNYFCANSKTQILKSSFILYLYFLFFAILIVQTYKLLEKLIAKKNHIQYFKYIFYAITPLVALILWLLNTNQEDTYLLVAFAGIMSVAGLLMIELRKKK